MEGIKYKLELSFADCFIYVKNIGADINIIFSGGDKPHIGSVVLSVPRESLKNDGTISATTSVLNVLGHKDEEICRILAEGFCKKYNSLTLCSGGFHIENISTENILELIDSVKNFIELL
ncbi:MAG: hypothetical protein ACRC7S_19130 [Cetobacterium sp.]